VRHVRSYPPIDVPGPGPAPGPSARGPTPDAFMAAYSERLRHKRIGLRESGRSTVATICLLSALARHDLTDAVPARHDIALPRDKWHPRLSPQVSRPVAACRTNLKTAFRRRRSGTTETSLVTSLVTDLVTGHTRKRPSPNGKGPLTCDDVGSGGTRQTCVQGFARRASPLLKRGFRGICHPFSWSSISPLNQTRRTAV
jgi:hypothetical protein